MKKYDVVALGELLIDFINNGVSEQGNNTFEASPGGAPCNVLAMLTKLGKKCAFIGKVGDDIFGKKLKGELEKLAIDTDSLKIDKDVRTTLAFVENDASGDRSFSFYRNPGADINLSPDEVDEDIIKSAKVFHFGTLSMTHEPVKSATKKALSIAKENGCMITFDPNLREMLWQSESDAKIAFDFGMKFCDVLKISDNELVWFTGEADYDKGVNKLLKEYNIPVVLLSMGSSGSRAYCDSYVVEAPAFLQDSTVDTTGAGDTFMGCCINYILENGMETLNDEKLSEMLLFANAAAAVITTRKGALKAMPSEAEILKVQTN
ncbi:MAG: carbohydrate kinase [Ruminococcaceae bacterium]|nr:carbohydrate kinase [Oscillospiraceae bacterium]